MTLMDLQAISEWLVTSNSPQTQSLLHSKDYLPRIQRARGAFKCSPTSPKGPTVSNESDGSHPFVRTSLKVQLRKLVAVESGTHLTTSQNGKVSSTYLKNEMDFCCFCSCQYPQPNFDRIVLHSTNFALCRKMTADLY